MTMRRVKVRDMLPEYTRHGKDERKFFQRMAKSDIKDEGPRRMITTELIDRYFKTGEKEAQERLIEWGDKAVPKIYIRSRMWDDLDFTIRAIRILKRMNTELSKEAVSFLSPEWDYTLYEYRR